MKIRVYYEDTDIGGVVYHSNYLNFCERARSELFFKVGESPILEHGHFVAKHIDANFIKSAKFADLLDVETELLEMKNASFKLLQSVYKDGEKIFEMKITLAYLDHNGRLSKLDDDAKELLKKIL